ncbi:cysteine peptidase family C39 domain-containing protein [Brevundimonas diminuta]|uniref:cysteine peptidase family C39 domain-containing protein n=1 Tax=Brevundimonas diminuta TaxID=293 RepID=UPI0037C5D466
MVPITFLAQQTAGGCGACSLIMVARYFDPQLTLTEDEVLEEFGVDGFGPRCLALAPSFDKAGLALGLSVRIASLTRKDLRNQLVDGPVIIFHKASEASDALPHFSVALAATETHIVRHDPGAGPGVVQSWDQFEPLWSAAKVNWWPYVGCYTVVLRPHLMPGLDLRRSAP